MAPLARHADWLLTDSEAMPDADFIERFRREWAASGADARGCVAMPRCLPSQLCSEASSMCVTSRAAA